MTAHWYSVVTEQIRILLTSGLYNECEEINIGCIGSLSDKAFLEKFIISQYPKLKIKYYGEDPLQYEFPTLRLIEADRSDYAGFYFHTKGVTRPFESNIQHWRVFLNEKCINQWRHHYENILDGYDISSVNFLKSPDHFSGNFWWFKRSYIDTLPPIDHLDLSNRYHAEQYVAMGKGKFYYPTFQEPGETVFKFKYR